MKIKIRRLIRVTLVASVFATICSGKLFAFGEGGCRVNPEDLKGACMKNTENIWKCINDVVAKDCTSSD